jgi:tetrapyrrole methylase family protein/MazG family protein
MSVKSILYVLGLGPAGLQSMTLGDYQLIKKANRIFFRTFNHPCAEELLKEGIQAESLMHSMIGKVRLRLFMKGLLPV